MPAFVKSYPDAGDFARRIGRCQKPLHRPQDGQRPLCDGPPASQSHPGRQADADRAPGKPFLRASHQRSAATGRAVACRARAYPSTEHDLPRHRGRLSGSAGESRLETGVATRAADYFGSIAAMIFAADASIVRRHRMSMSSMADN